MEQTQQQNSDLDSFYTLNHDLYAAWEQYIEDNEDEIVEQYKSTPKWEIENMSGSQYEEFIIDIFLMAWDEFEHPAKPKVFPDFGSFFKVVEIAFENLGIGGYGGNLSDNLEDRAKMRKEYYKSVP